MRKKIWRIVVSVLVVLAFVLSLAACVKETGTGEVEVENPSGVSAAELTLTDDQMVAALKELARRTENQMLAVDSHAKVEFRVADDGSCGFYAIGTEDDGTVADEMEEISTGESVKAFFDSYYNAGFFDTQGNVLGFPEEVPEDQLAKDTQPDMNESESIRQTVMPEGGSGEIAGFPGEGTVSVEDAPEAVEGADLPDAPANVQDEAPAEDVPVEDAENG